jgi:hypothetical protein
VDLRRPVPFALLTLASFLVARWTGVGLHEVLGHGLFTLAAGGSFYGVYVSPVTGFALVHLPVGAPVAAKILVDLAGILMEILLGVGIFLLYPRVRTFIGRLFTLALLEILLVYSFAYLALGVFGTSAGDPYQVVKLVEAPHLGAAFFVVGLVWAVATGYVVSLEVLRLIAPSLALWRQLAYVLLFWTVPLPVAAIPNVFTSLATPGSLVTYVVLVVTYVLLAVMIGAGLLFAGIPEPDGAPGLPPPERASGRVAPMAIAALLILPAWFAFGLTSDSAERLLLTDPPLAAERELASPTGINVRVTLTNAQQVVLEFRMKGVPEYRSPLLRQAWATFEDRADFSFWVPAAGFDAKVMMNATVWNVTGQEIDRTSSLWVAGREYANARLLTFGLGRPEDAPSFLNVTQNGTRRLLTLTILEPFRNRPIECPRCFLDELNLTWSGGSYVFVSAAAEGGNPEALVVPGLRFARYRASTFEDSPERWRLVLEIV